MEERILNCDNCINNPKSVFNVLRAEEKELLKKNHSSIFYKKGETIFKEGDCPAGLISLAQGKVKILKEDIGGREQIVRIAKPVSFIGYRAVFAEENHTTTAVAIEDSLVCMIEKDIIFQLIRSNSEMSLSIIKSFATEMGFSNNRSVTLTQKHIRGRLAESLIFLKDTYGLEDDGQTIKIYLSGADVANISNMSRSSALQTFSSLAEEGVISIDGRKIKILDFAKLDRISEMD